MFSTILLVALSTVSGHKCHGCAVYSDCCAPACNGCAVVCNGCSACSCARAHKCGLFKRLFSKRCACSCACYGCAGCHGCAAPACCDPCGCAAPACAGCASPSEGEAEKAGDPQGSGFKVHRSPYLQVSYEAERAEYSDEPVVIFARR